MQFVFRMITGFITEAFDNEINLARVSGSLVGLHFEIYIKVRTTLNVWVIDERAMLYI